MQAQDRIIVALDVDTLVEAGEIVRRLHPHRHFKIGLQLMTCAGGPQAVAFLHDLGVRVFYDIKLPDVPKTVGAATANIASQNVWMFSVHASASVASMQAAVAHKRFSKALGVSVLTSISDDPADHPNTSQHIFNEPCSPKVSGFADDIAFAGMDGIICSSRDLELVSRNPQLDRLIRVTPAIRPHWAPIGGHKRAMTPSEAITAGADYLVIGKPITNPPKEIGSPEVALRDIILEVKMAPAPRRRPLDD